MTRSACGPVLLLCCATAFAEPPPAPGDDIIPPVQRMDRHFEEGAGFLRALPDGSQIKINRMDGAAFTLTLTKGKFTTSLPAAQLSPDQKVWTSPLGYKLYYTKGEPTGMVIESPRHASTTFVIQQKWLVVRPKNGTWWSWELETPFLARLTDGTRIDMLERGAQWEVISLNGERARLQVDAGTWAALPPLPSPPLVPDVESVYPSGLGDAWRKPGVEDHVVFAWNWYPVGFTPGQAIDDVRSGVRRNNLNRYFEGLAMPQPPAEMAACLIGRRLALGGGDQVTFESPSSPPVTALLLPGPQEPNYFLLHLDEDVRSIHLRMKTRGTPRR